MRLRNSPCILAALVTAMMVAISADIRATSPSILLSSDMQQLRGADDCWVDDTARCTTVACPDCPTGVCPNAPAINKFTSDPNTSYPKARPLGITDLSGRTLLVSSATPTICGSEVACDSGHVCFFRVADSTFVCNVNNLTLATWYATDTTQLDQAHGSQCPPPGT
ncbi:MAG: hypothetical protein JWP89_1263 [Schlesneria sp.]|nr:hypothetical protein [Schlesneria sp.]